MSQLTWVTPAGSIANLPIGLPTSVQLLAVDTTNNGSTLTYNLISGELPTGLQLNSATGEITGEPTYSSPSNNYFTTLTYSFVVRLASSNNLTPVDRQFSIILTNEINADFAWTTPAGSLGTVPNGEFYQLPLQTTAAGTKFKFISGELPPGMQVVSTGFLQGVPTLTTSIATGTAENFRFTIRATNSQGHVRDQAFSLSVTNVYGPVIEPTTGVVTSLGSVFDGSYFSRQLSVIEPNTNTTLTWSNIGNLPPGVTLSSTGLLSGYIQPTVLVGADGPAGYDGETYNELGLVSQAQEYDHGPYDFDALSKTLIGYTFTIRAFDGANYDLQTYTLDIVSRVGFTSDNGNITVDNNGLTIDTTNVYVPILTNSAKTLPTARAGSNYAFKFDGYDFQNDQLTYSLSITAGTFDAYVVGVDAGFDYGGSGPSGGPEAPPTPTTAGRGGVGFDSYNGNASGSSNLPGLILDAQSGWLYGQLHPQSSSYEVYTFGVQVSKSRLGITYLSDPIYFKLPVLGDVNNNINWVTQPNLGNIDNGSVSELALEAVSVENKPLIYKLVDQSGISIRLPQGLTLLPSGEISGRVSFEAFSIDDYMTTFDGDKLTIDRVYKFTVVAETDDTAYYPDGSLLHGPSASSVQEFTLTLNIIDVKPYNNLYLHAYPAHDQRQIYNSVISDNTIFPSELIYRPTDPWFGIKDNIEMLFLPGLDPDELNTYANAMIENHYTKTYTFGDISTAVVLDDNYNVKYEVVYVNVIDPEEFSGMDAAVDRKGPTQEINLTNTIANPYIDANGNEYKIIYPNSSENMTSQLVSGVGYYDQSSLPKWMTSNQPSTTAANKFTPPLGFVKAVVLAYTVPGASKLIAYRLQNSGINFNRINFTVDRYLIDDNYTANFNTATQVYTTGRETTFDALPNQNIGAIVTSVTYAVTVPYDQINGRPVNYINSNGGIDKVKNFQDGDTLIFAQQENFLNPGPYDGWVNYQDAWIGDDTQTPATEGYGGKNETGRYDKYNIVTGFLENKQNPNVPNNRGGVWRINIINSIVVLTPVLSIEPNQRIRILLGGTYGGSIMYYNQLLAEGQTVPYYKVYKTQVSSGAKRTTFNGDSTKFFSHRDAYYEPGTQDHYLKFPQYGMFT